MPRGSRRTAPPPQRGTRPAAHAGLRGSRGVPGAGGVAQPDPEALPGGHVSTSELVSAVESDVALATAVLRVSNQVQGKQRGKIDSIVTAVEVLTPQAVHALATRARTFDFFERGGVWDVAPEHFRLHALATQRAADRLAAAANYPNRDRLMVTSLLHDIGKLVLLHAYPGYPEQIHGDARTPEDRLQRERRELGVDHALVGGVLARRWGLPKAIASIIERHHGPGGGHATGGLLRPAR